MRRISVIMMITVMSVIMLLCHGAQCYAADTLDFDFRINGKILEVYIAEPDENASYMVSINGGKSFIPMTDGTCMQFRTLRAGTYQLCVKKQGDDLNVSHIRAAVLGRSNIKEENEIRIEVAGCTEKDYKDGEIELRILEYDRRLNYIYSTDGGRIWKRMTEDEVCISGLIAGEYDVQVRSLSDPEMRSRMITVKVPHKPITGAAYVSVDAVLQLPELPTGCEVTSLAMALGFYDLKVPKTVLADFFLPKAEYRTADYRKYFVGNPREIKAYGCYAGVLVQCAEKYFSTVRTRSFDINNITGCEPEQLYACLDKNYPVIVWATGGLGPTKQGPRWLDRETGEIITWVSNEHCMLLTGYDKKQGVVWVNDPLKGAVAYDMKLFEQRFAELEKQAIMIVETTDME